MLEALHLDGADHPVAVLLEGPALRLRRVGVADVYAPLPRLARVVAHGPRVQWRTEALIACAEAGVPVVLMSGRGRVRAVLVPLELPAVRRDLAAALDAAATGPGFRACLEDFCRAELRRAVLATPGAGEMVAGAVDMRAAPLRAVWLGRESAASQAHEMWGFLRELGAAAVAEGLARRGVGGQFMARRSGGFALPAHLGEALVQPLCPLLGRLARRLEGAEEERRRREVIRLFENAALDAERDRMLARLAIRLAAEA